MKNIVMILLLSMLVSLPIFANGTTEEIKTTGSSIVKVWSYFGGEEGQIFASIIDEYNRSQEKYTVEVEFVPFGDIKKKFSMGLVAQELPDIGMVDNPDMAAFSSLGLFEDITDKIEDWGEANKYFPGPIKSAILDGKYYGLPITSNCLAMYYNKDILDDLGLDVPTSWEDLISVGKTIAENGYYALALSAVKSEEGVFQYLPWYLSTGAVVEKPNSPESIKALEFYHTLIEEGIMSSEVISWTQADVQKQFSAGKAVMMINGPWNINAVKKDSPDMNWGIAMVPKDKKFASVLGGENMGIIKGGNVEGAWDFLKFFASEDVVDRFISNTGYFPPRKDVADKNERWKKDPILSVFMEQMKFAMPRGPHANWPQISDAMSDGMQKGMLEIKSIPEAMEEAQSKIDEFIK